MLNENKNEFMELISGRSYSIFTRHFGNRNCNDRNK